MLDHDEIRRAMPELPPCYRLERLSGCVWLRARAADAVFLPTFLGDWRAVVFPLEPDRVDFARAALAELFRDPTVNEVTFLTAYTDSGRLVGAVPYGRQRGEGHAAWRLRREALIA